MKLYLASAENYYAFNSVLEPTKAPNILMSYYYLRNRKHAEIEELMKRAKKFSQLIFLDSWAHTFLASLDLKKEGYWWPAVKTVPDAVVYWEAYIEWLKKYSHHFDVIAELDVWAVPWVGYNLIRKWRMRLCKMWLRDKLIVVAHHKYFSKIFKDWREERNRMLDSYKYLAIWDDPNREILDVYFGLWQKKGNWNRIHGFAETKNEKMLNYPYWSVDSTSRAIGSRYWQMVIFDKPKCKIKIFWGLPRNDKAWALKAHDKFKKRYNYFEPEAKRMYTLEDMRNKTDGAKARDTQNAYAFRKMWDYVTRIRDKRGIDFYANPPKVNKVPST